jgi:hypothetical protein
MELKNKTFIIILLIVGIGVGLVHVFLMPPFQNPDEVQHFLYSARYAYGKRKMEAVEARVLQLLKDHKWFHFVGIGPGWENTEKISDISYVFHFDPERKTTRETLFHFLYGNVLKISGIKNVSTAFYFLRILSTFFYIAILLLAFFFFKTYFPDRWEYFFIGLLLVFQLGTILNAVNYDVFMVLLGSLFFISAYRYLCCDKKIDLAFLLVFAGLAALTKLVGFMFFVYLFILLCMKIKIKWNLKLMQQAGLVLLVFIIVFSWLNYIFPGRFFDFYTLISRLFNGFAGSSTLDAEGVKALRPGFFNSLVDSFFFYTGWMGFKLSSSWYILLKIFLFISTVGVFWALSIKSFAESKGAIYHSKHNTPSLLCKCSPTQWGLAAEGKTGKKWLIYMLIVLVLQVFSVWFYYGSRPISQGRYLYPLVIPIILLMYPGLQFIEKRLRFNKSYLVISFILFQVVMTVFAVVRVISVFYLEIASPHPGL